MLVLQSNWLETSIVEHQFHPNIESTFTLNWVKNIVAKAMIIDWAGFVQQYWVSFEFGEYNFVYISCVFRKALQKLSRLNQITMTNDKTIYWVWVLKIINFNINLKKKVKTQWSLLNAQCHMDQNVKLFDPQLSRWH